MNRTDYEEDEVDTTCPISPIAPCTPYRGMTKKLDIVVRPRQSPMFSPTAGGTQLGNIRELSDEEIELKCLLSPSPSPTPIPSTPEDPKKQPKKKSIRFNKRVRIQKIRHINDFSQQRVDDIWFTESECKNMKAETLTTLQLMLADKPLGKDHTSRGLEYRLPAVYHQRQQDKHTHLHSVLDEQDQQWARQVDDAQRIADISSALTAEHRAAACTRGLIVQDTTVKSASKTRKSAKSSSKMCSSVKKSTSSSQHHNSSGQEVFKDIKSKTHSEHNRRNGVQMTFLSAAA
jgi:hypothetical protein